MAFHARSISLPTKSHSYVLKAEAELHKLRASLSSSSHTSQIILDALQGVCSLYESIDDVLRMSSNQNGMSHSQQRRHVDQELEGSIELLEICSTSRDNLGEIKTHVQDLDLALRRYNTEAMKSKARDYIRLVKKSNKAVKKQVARRSEPIEGDALEGSGLLREARDITVSLLQSIFSFLSKRVVGQKTNKWSLLQKRRVECQENAFDISSLRVNVEELHNGLECVVRQMIQCRVSLLNNCTL